MRLDIRLRLSLMMFLQYFVWGAWFVTLATYLSKGLSFSGPAIGWCYAALPIAAMISPFFVGVVADRFFATERVLAALHLLGGAILLYAGGAFAGFAPSPKTFELVFPVILFYALCYMPTLALTNALSFRQMQDPSKEFPGIRVLGTIGWIAAGTIIGLLRLKPDGGFTLPFLESSLGAEQLTSIEATSYPMIFAGLMSVLLGAFCFFLPHTPPKKGDGISLADILGLDALQLMRERSFAVFVIGSFLICIPLQFYYNFTNQFLNEVKFPNPAFSMTFGQWSEIVFMLAMPIFFRQLGVKKMLLCGTLAWAIRYFLFSTEISSALLAGIILHGICYDFFFVTGQIYVDQKAPPQLRGAAQGFIAFVTLGAGGFIGSIAAGRILALFEKAPGSGTYNWNEFWRVPAVLAFVVLIVFAILFREKRTADTQSPA